MPDIMFLVADKYRIEKKLGSGSFGDVYLGVDVESNIPVAIKLEHKKCRHPQLKAEADLYHTFVQGLSSKPDGFPEVKYFGEQGDFNVMVLEFLGPSLEDLFNYCGRKFSLKTVLQLLDQCLQRLEFTHSRGWIHRDIKPDNFIMGVGIKCNICYLIDYGLSKPYLNRNRQHVPFNSDRSLTGTARYASLNNHLGKEQSRRDDLESLAYTMVYFLKGSLPWQGLIETSIQDLCTGLPCEFSSFISYCQQLKYEEEPNYTFWREKFNEVAEKEGVVFDGEFDWVKKRNQEKINS
ncbi:Casein kinase [Entamoeba marina]